MSKDNVRKMFGKIEKDSQLRKKYAEMMQAHQKDAEKALGEKLVELGRTSGFAFSNDDLLAARAELIDLANANRELSEKDLTGVAGGMHWPNKVPAAATSVITLGIGCAILSIMENSKKRGGCAALMSTDGSRNCTDGGY